jgi:hypothetical protein
LDKDAMAKSLLVLLALVLLAAASTAQRQHGGGAATATAAPLDDDDGVGDDLQRRQEAMEEAVKVFSGYNPDTSDPRALKRAVATVNDALAPLRPIFKAISRMPEGTAKEEARAASHELLARHLGELLPGGSVKVTGEL